MLLILEEGRGRERNMDEREKLIGCLLHALHWEWSLQPGSVPPRNGAETYWCMGAAGLNSNKINELVLPGANTHKNTVWRSPAAVTALSPAASAGPWREEEPG